MKKIFFIFSCIALIACSSKNNVFKNDKQATIRSEVEQALASGNYTIKVASASPSSGRLINLNDNYTITVRNDSAISWLPYYGRSYRAPMSPDESGIKFKEPIKDYTLSTTKKGMYQVKMEIYDKYDYYTIHMDISPTGSSSVRVNSNNKTPISFFGDLVLSDSKK